MRSSSHMNAACEQPFLIFVSLFWRSGACRLLSLKLSTATDKLRPSHRILEPIIKQYHAVATTVAQLIEGLSPLARLKDGF